MANLQSERIQLNQSFFKALERLNNRQREAVEAIEGPVLVVAGPGTGKTQILSARIGNILQKTDTRPDNILCLTYTDAGAIAMRKRLLQFIGPEAHRVSIFTFHAYCNKVIQENLDTFGIRNLEPISELEQIELANELIDGFGKDHGLKRWTGDIYYERTNLISWFSTMKREGWTPEFVVHAIDQYVNGLEDDERFQYKRANNKKGIEAGDPNQRLIDAEKKKMDRLRAATLEFDNYQQKMLARGRYDYDDMINWVLEEYRKPDSELLIASQERYLYFLVDEYQDTNGSQNEILEHLTSYWDVPNVFVVGDDDQSIYRFQGANIGNIMDFYHKHKEHVKTIMMTDNYRSSQPVLDWSKRLIDWNEQRLINQDELEGLEKNLRSSNPGVSGITTAPEVVTYINSDHETVTIANEILQMHENKGDLSEVAVIYPKHAVVDDLVEYLHAKGVPLNLRKKVDVLSLPLPNQILTILKYLEAESEKPGSRDDLLFEILHYDFFDIPVVALAKESMEVRRNREHYRNHFLNLKVENNLFSDGKARGEIKQTAKSLEKLVRKVHNLPLQQIFEAVLNECGILKQVMNSVNKTELLQEINTLYDFIKGETKKRPTLKLKECLRTIDLLVANRIRIPVLKTYYAENGVNLVTAHSAKGLEFEKVFLMGCTSDLWGKGRSSGFSIPPTLAPSNVAEVDETEERRRLFYVAVTRAKTQLQLSYSLANRNGKELEPCVFLSEVSGRNEMEQTPVAVNDNALSEFYGTLMLDSPAPTIELAEVERIRQQLENYSLSVTNLSHYLKCPLGFYFQHVLRVPSAKSVSMSFGTAVHETLRYVFEEMKKSGEFPPESELLRSFKYNMDNQKDAFTDEEYDQKLEYGNLFLPKYYAEYKDKWNMIVSTEFRMKGVVDEVPLNGAADKLEFDGLNVNVVDYKTGKHENSIRYNNLNRPGEKIGKTTHPYVEQYGGDYWRQAVFYKILLERQKPDYTVRSVTFDYVEPDSKTGEFKQHEVHITPQDIAILRDQIKTAYQKIQNLEFDTGCGEENCSWCTFVKSNYKEVELSES